MADGVFNIAKGEVNAYVNRVINNDPATAVLSLVALDTVEVDDTLDNYDDLAALLVAAGNVEATNGGYARQIVTDADGEIAVTIDDTGNTKSADFSDQTFSSVAAGNAWVKLLICYDGPGTAVDANMIPLCFYDFAVTPDGSDITVQLNASGFFQAA